MLQVSKPEPNIITMRDEHNCSGAKETVTGAFNVYHKPRPVRNLIDSEGEHTWKTKPWCAEISVGELEYYKATWLEKKGSLHLYIWSLFKATLAVKCNHEFRHQRGIQLCGKQVIFIDISRQ